MSYPPQSGGPGDGVVIPVSSLPTHEGAEIARLRALIETIRDERDKFSRAGAVRIAQQMRTEAERDQAQAEIARLRGLIDNIDRALGRHRSTGDYIPLLDAAERAVNERTLP